MAPARAASKGPAQPNVAKPYPAPELRGVQNWINTASPLTLASLRGKVVIVDFWTFECINCVRTLPATNALYAKYHARGLEIIGVHAPEFDRERDLANVRSAVAKRGIKFPVVQDNDFTTWRAYNNRFWPAFYVIDKQGRVRDEHFGEGGYRHRDDVVAALLAE
jgi:thiol-disulfide isomerase/thioredoxin